MLVSKLTKPSSETFLLLLTIYSNTNKTVLMLKPKLKTKELKNTTLQSLTSTIKSVMLKVKSPP